MGHRSRVRDDVCPRCRYAQRRLPHAPDQIHRSDRRGRRRGTIARSIGQNLSGRIAQPVVIENRPGGGGTIGAELTAQAAPDGHTVLVTSSSFITYSLLYPTRYDPVRDFSPVTQLVQHPYVMVIPAIVPASSVGEFVAWAK